MYVVLRQRPVQVCQAFSDGYAAHVHVGDGAQSLEAQWLHAAASGDAHALGCLYDRFAPHMLAVAQHMLRSTRDAEDLVHDVFLEAWHRARHYDPTRGSVQTWLMMRLRSRALDRLRALQRRDKAHRATDASEAPVAHTARDSAPDDQRQAAALHGWLDELNADQRDVLELAYFEGLTLAEIALRLGVPIGTVKSRLSRAVAELRTRIQASGGTP